MKYVRRHPEVDALEFTPEMGTLVEGRRGLDVSPEAREMGITYAEGKGYAYRGKLLRFGDYIVTTAGVKAVWTPREFEAQFRKDES